MKNQIQAFKNFIRLSKYAGSRFDLTQASGGNSSVKINNTMYIKATGFSLADVEQNTALSKVPLNKVQAIIKTPSSKNHEKRIKAIYEGCKPSIEILMHALLGKFVLHLHPVAVNALICQKNCQKQLASLFPKALYIPYLSPGIELAKAIEKILEKNKVDLNQTVILFLQNHGVVVSSQNSDDIIKTIEKIVNKTEKHLGFNFNDYKLSTKILGYINAPDTENKICYLSDNQTINKILSRNKKLFLAPPFCLISYLYNGKAPLEIKTLTDRKSLTTYRKKYKTFPRVILHKQKIFFIASNLTKAHEMEDVLKAHLLILDKIGMKNIKYSC